MKHATKLILVFFVLALTAGSIPASNGRRNFSYEFLVFKGTNAERVIRYAHNLVEEDNVRNELRQGEIPINDASIAIEFYYGADKIPLFSNPLKTNSDGRAAFSEQLEPGVQPGRYHVTVSKPGYIIYEFDMQNQDPEMNTRNTMFNKVKLRESPAALSGRLRLIKIKPILR